MIEARLVEGRMYCGLCFGGAYGDLKAGMRFVLGREASEKAALLFDSFGFQVGFR